jgi:hypothetical protein
VNRRRFLVAGVSLLGGGVLGDDLQEAWETLSQGGKMMASSVDAAGRVTNRLIGASETLAPADLLRALQEHMQVLARADAVSASLHRRLLSIRGLEAALGAQKLFQLRRPQDQVRYLRLAFDLSKEAGDVELRSVVVALQGREVWSSLELDPSVADDHKALEYVEAAAGILSPRADPQIRTHIRAGRAEFSAAVGEMAGCVMDLDAARQLILRYGPFESGSGLHAPHDLMELDAMAASCGALLGSPTMAREGIEGAKRALDAMAASWTSWRATITADEGAAYALMGEADVAAEKLIQAVELADQAGSRHNRARVANHRRSYLAGVETAAVHALEERLQQAT